MAPATPIELLRTWLGHRLPASAVQWLDSAASQTKQDGFRPFAMAFSMASRKVGKADLALSAEDLAAADAARPDWNPSRWSTDQAARTILVLTVADHDRSGFGATLDRVFAAADVGELVALYQALPLLPDQARHVLRAAEGVRSNMKAVFEAVAHRNPFPSEQFDEGPWNQMVLKALFVGTRLAPIVGLERRGNASLARMLWDYARERRAAKRPVSPELWRCVGPFAPSDAVEEMTRRLPSENILERQGAALALASCPDARATEALQADADAWRCIHDKLWTWDEIALALDRES